MPAEYVRRVWNSTNWYIRTYILFSLSSKVRRGKRRYAMIISPTGGRLLSTIPISISITGWTKWTPKTRKHWFMPKRVTRYWRSSVWNPVKADLRLRLYGCRKKCTRYVPINCWNYWKNHPRRRFSCLYRKRRIWFCRLFWAVHSVWMFGRLTKPVSTGYYSQNIAFSLPTVFPLPTWQTVIL